jgi:nickel-dependent lactate racemase
MVESGSTRISLPYGHDEIQFDVSQARLLGVLTPRTVAGVEDAYSTIAKAIRNPVDGQSLASHKGMGGTVTIVTDDHTRPTPAGPICSAIMDELNSLGIDDTRITILAAGGLHRPMTKDELREKFGEAIVKRANIVCHDAWDETQLEYVGVTTRGTPVWVNRLISRASLRVIVGMITAHFVSGYASGPKTILPGASGYRTIFHNHGIIAASPSAKIGVTQGNPCWEDMVEAASLLEPTLAVDVVLNTRNELVEAYHGKPVSAQNAGLDMYHKIYTFDLKEKADIVIASANPMYSYLDQCLKTIVHTSMLVRDGGIRIVASPCAEHLGPPFLKELYYKSLGDGWPEPDKYMQIMKSGGIKDVADAVGILKFLQSNNSALTLVCDPSFEQDLTNLGFSRAPTVQSALDESTARLGINSKVLVIPYGAVTHAIP